MFKNLELPVHPTQKWKKRKWSDIKGIVVHQSASKGDTLAIAKYHTTPTKDRDGDGIIEAWERNHISSKGAPGICYHFTIEPDGTMVWCNDLLDIVWHAGNASFNLETIGICVIGNFSGPSWEGEEPTKAQLKSLKKLLDFLTNGWDPQTLNISKHKVFGHCEVKPKKENCPGNTLMEFVTSYRKG